MEVSEEALEEVISMKRMKMTSSDSDPLEINSSSPPTTNVTTTPKRRGRRAKGKVVEPEIIVPTMYHVAAEHKQREKLNNRFYALGGVVPYVSKMDKAYLLSDAVTYINELKSTIQTLEKKMGPDSLSPKESRNGNFNNHGHNSRSITSHSSANGFDVEVKLHGSEAMIRVQSADINHPSAKLMDALRSLDLKLEYASVPIMNGFDSTSCCCEGS